jgi:hypothetical protein
MENESCKILSILSNRSFINPLRALRLCESVCGGGIGALVVIDDVGRYAEKAGLYVLTQTDEGGATLLNRQDFQPKAFS